MQEIKTRPTVVAVMSTDCLQKLNHVFVISCNTWHECGILGKKEKGEMGAHTSWVGKEKEKG